MKNLSLFVSAFALCASTSYAAINCSTLPSCDSLGYKDLVTDCPNQNKVLKCPFDVKFGKCIHDAKVGDLKYSLNTENHDGWILCNGQSLDTTKYATLYGIIESNYGMDGTKFRVPDYRGFFLRAFGEAKNNKPLSSFGGNANSSLKDPQAEGLPNIKGTLPVDDQAYGSFTGAFSTNKDKVTTSNSSNSGWLALFNASKSNTIYGRPDSEGKDTVSHVIPANYAANIFIYAGR